MGEEKNPDDSVNGTWHSSVVHVMLHSEASSATAPSSTRTPPPSISRSVNKRDRHLAIRNLISSRTVGSQEELRDLLRENGGAVTQSTLSRDLREMRIVRVPTPEGPRYVSPEALSEASASRTLLEDVLPQFFSSLEGVGHLLVIKTAYGGAQPVAEAVDDAGWDEVLGTIGGENTILVICRSDGARADVENRLRSIAGG